MIVIGQPLRVPFGVLSSTGGDYTTVASPPTLRIIQDDLTHTLAINAPEWLFGQVWAIQLTASEMASKIVTIAWSGTGIISGQKTITAEEEEVIEDALRNVSDQILLASPYVPTTPPTPQYVTPIAPAEEPPGGGWSNG